MRRPNVRGADIAGDVIDCVVENVAHPELDIRQMLTVSTGYGVVALQVGDDPTMVGKTIAESGLRDRDIVVLSLARDGKIIPNPRATRELHVGDRLTCWGKYSNVRDLLPTRPSGVRKKKPAPPADA